MWICAFAKSMGRVWCCINNGDDISFGFDIIPFGDVDIGCNASIDGENSFAYWRIDWRSQISRPKGHIENLKRIYYDKKHPPGRLPPPGDVLYNGENKKKRKALL